MLVETQADRAARLEEHRRAWRAATSVLLVVALGTAGFMWVEGWTPSRSLYFTLITLTTVGYGDYGLSEQGQRFTSILLVGGIGMVTYSCGQLLPIIFDESRTRRRKMHRALSKLSDHFIVCGLGRIGRTVCERLAEASVPFVAIDPDERVVDGTMHAGYMALEGDATDDQVLIQLGARRARGIACVTGSDTENIVITLSAREVNPDLFIISRAENPDAIRKIRRAGADRVISPIRTGGVTIADTIVTPHLADLLDRSHTDGGIQMSEMTVIEGSSLDGATVRDCGMQHDSIVFVALKHADGETRLRPRADETLRAGDTLIVAGELMALATMRREAGELARAA